MFMEMPSKMVSPPINETDNIDEIINVRIIRFHDGPEDDDILRDIRYYTSILVGEETLAPAEGVGGYQSPTDGGGGQQPAASGRSGRRGGPAKGVAFNSRGASPRNQVTPPVTRSSSRAASALLTTTTPRGLQQLCLYTNTTLPGVAHHMEMLTCAEYACADTNLQLQRSGGAERIVNLAYFQGSYTASWSISLDDGFGQGNGEYTSSQGLRLTGSPHHVHTARAEHNQLTLGLQGQGGQLIQGARGRAGTGASEWARLRSAPACRIQIIRMVLAAAAEKAWKV